MKQPQRRSGCRTPQSRHPPRLMVTRRAAQTPLAICTSTSMIAGRAVRAGSASARSLRHRPHLCRRHCRRRHRRRAPHRRHRRHQHHHHPRRRHHRRHLPVDRAPQRTRRATSARSNALFTNRQSKGRDLLARTVARWKTPTLQGLCSRASCFGIPTQRRTWSRKCKRRSPRTTRVFGSRRSPKESERRLQSSSYQWYRFWTSPRCAT